MMTRVETLALIVVTLIAAVAMLATASAVISTIVGG